MIFLVYSTLKLETISKQRAQQGFQTKGDNSKTDFARVTFLVCASLCPCEEIQQIQNDATDMNIRTNNVKETG